VRTPQLRFPKRTALAILRRGALRGEVVAMVCLTSCSASYLHRRATYPSGAGPFGVCAFKMGRNSVFTPHENVLTGAKRRRDYGFWGKKPHFVNNLGRGRVP